MPTDRARRTVGRATWAVTVGLAMALATATTACGAAPALDLPFDGAPRPDGTTVTVATNRGSASASASAVSVDGGRIVSASARPGASGRAIRFPRFDATAPAPRAVLSVTGSGSTDPLDPGTRTIQFGADFQLDSTSAQSGSAVDDGNNLLQRGLWDDRSQLKLEVDRGRVICRVKGRSGEINITGSTAIAPGVWYRTSCRRSGTRVTLTVGSWSSSGSYASRSWSRDGTTGSLTPSSRTVPWSVGGKLRSDGKAHPATDQFNGSVDNVVISIG